MTAVKKLLAAFERLPDHPSDVVLDNLIEDTLPDMTDAARNAAFLAAVEHIEHSSDEASLGFLAVWVPEGKAS